MALTIIIALPYVLEVVSPLFSVRGLELDELVL